MKWKVKGTDTATGMETVIVVDADWSKDARDKAKAKGIRVAKVWAADDPENPLSSEEFWRDFRLIGRLFIAGVGLVVIIGGACSAVDGLAEGFHEITGALWAIFGALLILIAKK
ncbi:MAG: hypothetical protein ACF8NJ_02415 [Phycisphaerales bacterium JB038]